MTIDLHDEYRRIGTTYDAFERLLGEADTVLYTVFPDVSGWSVAQQVAHILRANGMMLKGIQHIHQGSRIVSEEGVLNEQGIAVLETGYIPRGRMQAPAPVVPPEVPAREELSTSLARSRQTYADVAAVLSDLPAKTGRIPHRVLGMLNAAEWLRFTRIHSEHHLSIIHDIMAQQRTA